MSARVGQRHRDAAAIYKLQWLGDGSRVETVVAQAIADAERSGMERAAKIEAPAPRAHTYASENTDEYLAYEHGWNAGVTALADAIRAAAKGE